MTAITNGAELLLRLRESGTGETKLQVGRLALVELGPAATSKDVIEALRTRPDIVPGETVLKAEALAATGELPKPKAEKPNIEDVLLPETVKPAPVKAVDSGDKPVTREDMMKILDSVVARQTPPALTPEQMEEIIARATAKALEAKEAKDKEAAAAAAANKPADAGTETAGSGGADGKPSTPETSPPPPPTGKKK